MTISATDIVVPVCSKMPLLYLLTQKVAQKFGYVLGIGGQKPQGTGDVTAPPRRSEPLRSKVGGPKRSSPYFAGWDRLAKGG